MLIWLSHKGRRSSRTGDRRKFAFREQTLLPLVQRRKRSVNTTQKLISIGVCKKYVSSKSAYQVCQGIQLLTHQRRLFAPSCNSSVHKVEEETERHKRKRKPDVIEPFRLGQVSHRRQDRHNYPSFSHRCSNSSVLDVRYETYIRRSLESYYELAIYSFSGIHCNLPFNSVIRSARCKVLLHVVSNRFPDLTGDQEHQPNHGEMPCVGLEKRFLFLLTDCDLLAISFKLTVIDTYHLRLHRWQYWALAPNGLGFCET